ncbi:type VI secretion system tip protein TssI/VgrG [Zooshikella ganghwensis]|uniref:N-acetylmuramoyl-L-alanine amidase n=1 Tax=Zooshikella ganghwensis TaxID=202772 RepID=A0A4P9VTF7_9GAMM|nr:type VI secretion system tip protein TssI/VgrG [Zooshikella ganghwensis]RDH46149.1 type VI secretion system tip protein VgrG [Zooshikella ganghwensis]
MGLGNSSLFMFSVEGCNDEFRVVEFKGREQISSPFYFTVAVACSNFELSTSALINKPACLTFSAEEAPRYVHGIIVNIELIDTGRRFASYKVVLAPKLWRLEKRTQMKIFQQQDASQIIKTLLKDAGLKEGDDFKIEITGELPQRTYTTQYLETDLEFFNRILAEDGLHYHFIFEQNRHVLLISDTQYIFKRLPVTPEIPYIRHTGLLKRDYTIHDFNLQSKVQPNKITVKDYNFTKPSLKLEISEQTNQGDFEVYHHGGLFQKPDIGQKQAQTQLKAFQALKETGLGESNCVYLSAGKLFKLTEHNNPALNQEYLLYGVSHYGSQPQSLEEGASGGPSGYSSSFICIPNNVEFKARAPKPTINKRNRFNGIQNAMVVGPAGEEIYTDQYSRIKVQFNWDKDGKSNEKSSCWIRVAQPWTGASWGAVQIPRIGQEILLSFVNGDPDRPLIKGVLYNGRNKPPYKLPDQKTKTTVKTCSTPGGQGFNELRFEDKKAQEQIFIHGERDQDIKIENDKDLKVCHDRHLVVDKQNHIHIKQLLSESIHGTWKEDLWKKQFITVKQNFTEKSAKNYNREAGKEIHIKSSGKLVFDAGMQMSVSGSGSYFTLDPSGVKINGPTVRMNAGGSATRGTSSEEKIPEKADEANDKVVIVPTGQGKKQGKGKSKPKKQPHKGSGKSPTNQTSKVESNNSGRKQKPSQNNTNDINIIEDTIPLNRYSRPGTKLKDVKGIVIHWVAVPKAKAKTIRDNFEKIEREKRFASAHFVVGLEGEIIKVIPENEVAYHVGAKIYKNGIQKKLGNYPNAHTLGIECCHLDSNGSMAKATWNSLVSLASSLLKKFGLTESDLYLHQDVTGKPCHKYFVDNPIEWANFKNEVKIKM